MPKAEGARRRRNRFTRPHEGCGKLFAGMLLKGKRTPWRRSKVPSERPGRPIRRWPWPGSFGRFFSIEGARRRFGKGLSGEHVCEIYLRTGSFAR